jgi:cytochrome c
MPAAALALVLSVLLAFGTIGPRDGAARAAEAGAEPAAVPAASEAEAYEGLPEGPGRDAVYFNCTACHSLAQATQQRMDREEWDRLLDVMVRENGMHPMPPWARTKVLNYLSTHFAPDDGQDWAGLPPGEGRELVFYNCQACHSLAIVKQQGLDRVWWSDTLTWMVEEQAMPPLPPDQRDVVLDYLARHYGPDG